MGTSFGAASLAAQSSALQPNEDRVLHRLKSEQSSGDNSKIEKGAREFEAMLLATWMQQAEQSMASVPGADDEEMAGKDQMMSLGVQSVSTALAASGGIGIGKMIAQSMHRMAPPPDPKSLDNEQHTHESHQKI
jgi:Rod binding domain-containing protein